MNNQDAKDSIRILREKNHNAVASLRRKLQVELEDMCESSTGHDWYDWMHDPKFGILGHVWYTHIRSCCLCGKTETRAEGSCDCAYCQKDNVDENG